MKQPKILIVDDDQLFANLLANTMPDFQVKIVNDCVAAIEAVDQFQPDALVLDLLMPAATGFALLNELASYADTASLPIIVCSSAAQGLNQETLAASGVSVVLDKATMQPLDVYHYLKHLLAP